MPRCRWFLHCQNDATSDVEHPTLGWVDICDYHIRWLMTMTEPFHVGQVVRVRPEFRREYDFDTATIYNIDPDGSIDVATRADDRTAAIEGDWRDWGQCFFRLEDGTYEIEPYVGQCADCGLRLRQSRYESVRQNPLFSGYLFDEEFGLAGCRVTGQLHRLASHNDEGGDDAA